MLVSANKNRFWRGLFIAVVLAFVCPAALTAADAVHFVYKYSPGYSQDFKGEFGSEQNFYGRNLVTLVEMEFTETCVEVFGDTLYKMELSFNEVSSSMRMNDNLMPNQMDEALKGQTVSYNVDKYGKVSDLKAKSYITGWRQLSQMLNNVIGGWYPRLPDDSVEPGNSWKDERTEYPEEAQGMEVQSITTYKFKEIKKEKGRLCAKVEGEEKSIISGKTVNNFGEFNTDGKSKTKFEFMFDPDGVGIVKFKATMQMDVKMIDASDSPGKKEDTESHMSYEVKKEIK